MKQLLLLSAALIGLALSAPAQRVRQGASRSGPAATPRPEAHYVARRAHLRVPVRAVGRGLSERGRVVCARGPLSFGRWEVCWERALVPGSWQTRTVPAVHGWVLDGCGRRVWAVITPATCERVWVPARYETQQRRVWVRY
jgi:hypothetical protein